MAKRQTKAQRRALNDYKADYDKEHYRSVGIVIPAEYYEPLLRAVAADPSNLGMSDYIRKLVDNDKESDW